MPPLVSIITPTFNRDDLLPRTQQWVQAQTYSNIEWLILDDSPQPTRSLATDADPRIRYEHIPQRLTIGEKRNRLIANAQGQFIAHFDDDDYYAPGFLDVMISNLEAQQADFANLASWYLLDIRHELFGFWNLRQTTGIHYLCHADGVRLTQFTPNNNAHLASNYLGYGFTYVYRRKVWESTPYAAIDWGEDMQFVRAAAERFQLLSMEDSIGLVLHLLHAQSTSSCFPQYHLPLFLLQSLFAPCYPFIDSLFQQKRAVKPGSSLQATPPR